MHHIYCDQKKERIVEDALSLDLTGFFLFGTPGAVIAEGTAPNIEKYEKGLRRLRWQKFQVQGRCLSPIAPSFAGWVDAEDGNDLPDEEEDEEDIIEDPITKELLLVKKKNSNHSHGNGKRWHVVGGRLFSGFRECNTQEELLSALRERHAPLDFTQLILQPFSARRREQ